MLYIQWGLKKKLAGDPDVWLCHQCNDCAVRCPRGVRAGDVLASIRSFMFEHFAFPSFLGKALANPTGLVPLLLVPIIIIGALMWMNTGGNLTPLFQAGEVIEFGKFIPHGSVEVLFIVGNILIFSFAAVGLVRFWKSMKESSESESKVGFISASISTALEILRHNRFRTCSASNFRTTAHMLVFFGFGGALIATSGAVIALVIEKFVSSFPQEYNVWINVPFPLWHPIKIFGNLGGFAILIGLGLMVYQRLSNPENSGKAGYSMWLFIWMTGLVTMTGLGAQFLRIAEIPTLAYPVYYIHLVTVFFLLWYAPFSQFGHMFYRALAMIYATGIGRTTKAIAG